MHEQSVTQLNLKGRHVPSFDMKSVYLLPFFFVFSLCKPVTYDQRQDGELNVRADLQNFVIVALVPKLDGAVPSLFSALSKYDQKGLKQIDRRSGVADEGDQDDQPHPRVAEPFTEAEAPYQVDISQAKSVEAKVEPAASGLQVLRLSASEGIADSPVPDVVPVKDNRYVVLAEAENQPTIEMTKN